MGVLTAERGAAAGVMGEGREEDSDDGKTQGIFAS